MATGDRYTVVEFPGAGGDGLLAFRDLLRLHEDLELVAVIRRPNQVYWMLFKDPEW